jgi:hypothetical protein
MNILCDREPDMHTSIDVLVIGTCMVNGMVREWGGEGEGEGKESICTLTLERLRNRI